MMDATLVGDDQFHFEIEDAEATRNLPPDIWDTGVGAILVSVDFRWLWKLLTAEFGVIDPVTADMTLDAKIAARRDAVADFMLSLASWEAVEEAMAKMNLAWGRVRSGKALREQPTLAFRKSVIDIDDRAGGVRPMAQTPYRFSQATAGVRGPRARTRASAIPRCCIAGSACQTTKSPPCSRAASSRATRNELKRRCDSRRR